MDFIPYGCQWIDDTDIEEVIKTLKSDWITTGPKVKEFEDKLSDYIGCKYTVVVNSGTSALDIAVQSLDLSDGDEIITTPFTFMASSNSILYNHLIPVFVDIAQETRNINPDKVREKITDKTKAILYVDYAGQPCNINEIREIAQEHNLFLIEDACHALGAEFKGKKIGNFADMTIFSFHPVKPITTGEGGAIATDNEEFYWKLKMLRNHGINKDVESRTGDKSYFYDMKMLGRNYRLTDLQCALGISQLNKLDDFIKKRTYLANLYNDLFKDVEFAETPVTNKDCTHAWHLYTILLSESINRDLFFDYMRNNKIGVNVHYIPMYHFSYYKKHLDFHPKDFPITEDVFKRIVTLPLHPKMNEEEIRYVCDVLTRFCKKDSEHI